MSPMRRGGKLTFKTRDTSHVRPAEKRHICVGSGTDPLESIRSSLNRLITNDGVKENVSH
jgi:hypothetical protein